MPTDNELRQIVCPNFRTHLAEFNTLLGRLGGKAMSAEDVAARSSYIEGLSKAELSAYHQAHFYLSEQGGDFTGALHHVDAVERVTRTLQGKPPVPDPTVLLKMDPTDPRLDPFADEFDQGLHDAVMKAANEPEAAGAADAIEKAQQRAYYEGQGSDAARAQAAWDTAGSQVADLVKGPKRVPRKGKMMPGEKRYVRKGPVQMYRKLNGRRMPVGTTHSVSVSHLDPSIWNSLHEFAQSWNNEALYLDEPYATTFNEFLKGKGNKEPANRPMRASEYADKEGHWDTGAGEPINRNSYPVQMVRAWLEFIGSPKSKGALQRILDEEHAAANLSAEEYQAAVRYYAGRSDGSLGAEIEGRGLDAEPSAGHADRVEAPTDWTAEARKALEGYAQDGVKTLAHLKARGATEPQAIKAIMDAGGRVGARGAGQTAFSPEDLASGQQDIFSAPEPPAPLSQEGKPLKAPEKGTTTAGEGNAETERFSVDAPRRPMKTQRMTGPEAETAPPEAPTPTQAAASAEAAPALKPTGLKAVGRALVQAFSPASLSKGAGYAARSIREHASEMMRDYDRADRATKAFSKALLRMPVEERWDFIDRVENGAAQPTPELQKMADTYRAALDQARTDIQELGEGALDQFYADYFPHIWKDPGLAKGTFSKRPLEGSKSFLKKRSIPTIAEGRAAGLEPLTDNPNDLFLIKLREMYRYRAARRIIQDLGGAGQIKYVDARTRTPEGYGPIEDRFATVYGSGKIKVQEGYDLQMVEGLRKILGSIGVDAERIAKFRGEPDTWGQTSAGGIKTRFGGPEMVLTHEIGHAIDQKFGLGKHLFGVDVRDTVLPELQHLAEQRWGTTEPSGGFKKYVMKRTELVANLIHAYVHNPEMAGQMAPTAVQVLNGFIDAHPQLRGLRDVRPGLELGVGSAEFGIGGLEIKGRYVAPVDVARVLNNYLSPGLGGNPIYAGVRAVQNTMQMVQLGLSAFHGLMTSIGAAVNAHATGLELMARGDILGGLKSIGKAATVVEPSIEQFIKGNKMLQEWYGTPQGAEIAQIVDGLVSGGGRARMDPFYETFGVGADTVQKAFAEGRYPKAALLAPGAAIRLAARPILQGLVPRLKMGAFFDMFIPELERLGPEATHEQLQEAATRVWDSVDNRLGQLVYDNLFWQKSLKDIAMLSVRSLGWNLGTMRELGGAAWDVATIKSRVGAGDPWLSHRMAYAASLPIVAGYMGALYMAARGLKPESLRDYFQPRTGKKNKDGSDERVVLPTYMKDVSSYSSHPLKTVRNKLAPEWELFSEVANNETFYGDVIRDERDPFYVQAMDVAKHMAGAFVPFSLQTDRLGPDATPERRFEQFIGLTKVPRELTQSQQLKREGGVAMAQARKLRVDKDSPVQSLLAPWGKSYASPEQDWNRGESDGDYKKRSAFVDKYVADNLPAQLKEMQDAAAKGTVDADHPDARTLTDLDVQSLLTSLIKEADSQWWDGVAVQRKPKIIKRY